MIARWGIRARSRIKRKSSLGKNDALSRTTRRFHVEAYGNSDVRHTRKNVLRKKRRKFRCHGSEEMGIELRGRGGELMLT